MMDITPFNEDTVVEIDEFNFTIPEGYGEADTTEDTNDYGITSIMYNYFNNDGDLVGVIILYNGSDITLDDFDHDNYTAKKIAGKEGMYIENDDPESVDFFYIENNKYISLAAPDEATIEKMIEG